MSPKAKHQIIEETILFEKRLFFIVNVLASIFSLIAFIADLFIREESWTAINSFIPLIVFSGITFLAYRGVNHQKLLYPFIAISLFGINSTFFLFGGYNGGVVLIALALIVAIAIFSKVYVVRATVIVTIIMITILFFWQRENPNIVVQYSSAEERFFDYWISSIIALSLIYILVEKILVQYRKNQKEILEDKEKISYQNELIEQKNANLAELNLTKDKFFSIISHDLRNPLSTFKDGLKILMTDSDSIEKEDREEIINTLRKNADTTFELLENLLSWSRLQMGKFPFQPEKFIVNGLLSFNISLLESQAKRKQIFLKYVIDDVYQVYADKNMVSSVFRNILSNAIKFTPIGGKINIDIYKGVKKLKITITDNGVGMNDEVLSSLFKIDSAGSKEGTKGEKGTGLGLILCKEFVELNSGEIKVQSQPSKGSTFSFTIPIAPIKLEPITI